MFQLWVNYVLKRQMPCCPRLYVSSIDTLQCAGFLPLKLVFSTVLFGDELDSHCTSTLHCLESSSITRLISVLASGLLGDCECSQSLTCENEEFNSLPKDIWYSSWFISQKWHYRDFFCTLALEKKIGLIMLNLLHYNTLIECEVMYVPIKFHLDNVFFFFLLVIYWIVLLTPASTAQSYWTSSTLNASP